MRNLVTALLIIATLPLNALAQDHRNTIIPKPDNIQFHEGSIQIPSNLILFLEDQADRPTAELLLDQLEGLTGIRGIISQNPSDVAFIRVSNQERSESPKPESYLMSIDGSGVSINANGPGFFYAGQSLFQLIVNDQDRFSLPHLEISDLPRFTWRGMHLDVSRHFRSVEFVKKYIDLMARFKMNSFHWHLTEDQGWRIEIKAYPKLTEIGAWRSETMVAKNFNPYVGDGIPHGGFYTQDEIREVVAYAAERHINIVPEIEMPGHALAALAAYPELACTPGPFKVATTWGVFDDIFCPTENTFEFLENVLTEVLELFPSKYIHIGGDEVPKKRWEESEYAQELIRREGLADEHELQSWFIQRIERFLNSKERILIGWDEILEGGLAPNAIVMSWRGEAGGIEAASQGHDVVMSPGFALYFDHYQADPANEPLAIGGFSPLEHVYNYEPVPAELAPEFAHHVLGAQANMWSEYMKTDDHVEYMAFPRLLALAERVWSDKEMRDFDDFHSRLIGLFPMLDKLDVSYRIPEPLGWGDIHTLADEAIVRLETAVPGGCLQYTLDGTDPAEDAPCDASIEQRIPLMEGARATIKVVSVTSTGRRSVARPMSVQHLQMIPGLDNTGQSTGLKRSIFELNVRSCRLLADATVTRTEIAESPTLPDNVPTEYAQRFDGYLEVPFDGVYTINLSSDDGSIFLLDGLLEIDNDGLHGPQARTTKLALEHGLHRIQICHFQAGGGAQLQFEVKNARNETVNMKYWHRP